MRSHALRRKKVDEFEGDDIGNHMTLYDRVATAAEKAATEAKWQQHI